tara:strand:+ start:721 stop:993 length:273 start_codon:yes stop_codon:yes gene_type:complete
MQPASSPVKNENPEILPDLEVIAVKYILSGPGLSANRKHEKINEINIRANIIYEVVIKLTIFDIEFVIYENLQSNSFCFIFLQYIGSTTQ